MARYIDAERFFDDFTELRDYEYASNEYNADVAPVVHAHWETDRDDAYSTYAICSHCKDHVFNNDVVRVFGSYCPFCGAKMDEELEE